MPDSEQFTLVIQENHSSLRHYIGAFGVNPAWIDDIAQDTFLVAYRKWDDFQQVENPGAWLRAVAKNLVLNETAKVNRRQRLLNHNLTKLLVESEQDEAPVVDPKAHVARMDALRSCMGHLSQKTRGVVEARYFGELNSFQIAHNLTMKPTAVRKLLFHARQSLAECMRAKSIELPET
ncbi:MAG: sigma-70 family RNA polymerase sigma factor [Verrucomicrobiaceae bacterium]|nr:MAG: sigma-70 family RNA polymerase sigma factor [Verrucomicrobiaceae bacterium]